jgi:hypothetical protein
MKCKYCGKEKQAGEFDKFFTEEAIEDMFCSPACKQKHIEDNSKVVDQDEAEHPEWFGPTKLHEL